MQYPEVASMLGYYTLDIRAYSKRIVTNHLYDGVTFYVKEGPFFGSGLMPPDSEARTLVDHSWELEEG